MRKLSEAELAMIKNWLEENTVTELPAEAVSVLKGLRVEDSFEPEELHFEIDQPSIEIDNVGNITFANCTGSITLTINVDTHGALTKKGRK